MQISVYFGLTEIKATEAIDDLLEQDFIKLNAEWSLGLIDSAKKLFTDVASDVSLTSIKESATKIRFELATFCFFKNEKNVGDMKLGLWFKNKCTSRT